MRVNDWKFVDRFSRNINIIEVWCFDVFNIIFKLESGNNEVIYERNVDKRVIVV